MNTPTIIGSVQSVCKECVTAYPGEHATNCRLNTDTPAVWTQMEPCDKCAHDFYARASKERQPFDAEDHIKKPTSMFAKVKGEACKRCGDNSPKGTWDIAFPEHFILGESNTVKLPLYLPNAARQRLHAERAAAPKQRKLTKVA